MGTLKVFIVLCPLLNKMDVKEQILKGAEELFFRYGIKGVSMDDIAKHMSISKRTIYENYPTKDDLISAILKEHIEQTVENFDEFREKAKNAIEEIIMMMLQLRSMFNTMNPRLLFDLKKFHTKVWQEFQNFKQNLIMKTVADNIKLGIKQGLYRDDLDVLILSRLRIEEIELAWDPEIYPPSRYDLTKVQVCLLDHFLYGITNVKGHRMVERYKKQQNINVPL